MNSAEQQPERLTLRLGPAWLWGVLLVAGLIGWAVGLAIDPAVGNRALLVSFVYFTPLAVGMVAWPAVVVLARGRWMGPLARPALAGISFMPVSLVAFAALFFGREHWAVWMHEDVHDKIAWLNAPFLFGRDAIALLALWLAAEWFVWRATRMNARAHLFGMGFVAGLFVLLYCLVLSLLGFDMVMALEPHWFSALFGGYVFISGMYAAAAAWTLLTLAARPVVDQARRTDLAKLVLAFSLLTAYMMFSQLVVIWYENLPEETRFVVPRFSQPGSPWRLVSIALLATIYLGPLVLLLTGWAKRSRPFLAAVCVLILVMLWVERWWLVAPAVGGRPVLGLADLALLVAFTAALALGLIAFDHRGPHWHYAAAGPGPAVTGQSEQPQPGSRAHG